MPRTYEKIATTTLGSATASFTFSSIPGTYTDLIAVVVAAASSNLKIEFNSDTGGNYSNTVLYGSGSSALSARNSNSTGLLFGATGSTLGNSANLYYFMNYSNSSTNKTVLSRGNDNGGIVRLDVGLWRNTSAITSIRFIDNLGANLVADSTFTLYGIKAA
jgi:hypothetical protein